MSRACDSSVFTKCEESQRHLNILLKAAIISKDKNGTYFIIKPCALCRKACVLNKWYTIHMKSILFLCHGNICRSPMVEFGMKKVLAEARRDDIKVESGALHTDGT